MKHLIFCFFFICVAFGCKEQNQTEIQSTKEPLIMVEQSEMALLMNQMYAYNESIKYQIEKDSLVSTFPEFFNKIHTAVLTEPSDRNDQFESNAKHFVDSQQALFTDTDVDLKTRFNNTVNACISCHKVTCVGPIPRIKKLLIK